MSFFQMWFELSQLTSTVLILPKLQINYDRNLGNLIVHVLQARNLAPRDIDGYSDPFVKVYLLPGRGWVLTLLKSLENVWSVSPFLLLCLSCLSLPCFLSDVSTLPYLTSRARMREWEWIRWHEAVIWASSKGRMGVLDFTLNSANMLQI